MNAKRKSCAHSEQSERVRYYLHGDEVEGRPDTFYCRRCDLFVDREHFVECAERAIKFRGIDDAGQIAKGLGVLSGKSTPAWLILSRDPMKASREVREYRRTHYRRPAHARTVWD
ncbi:MAG: hypothetical protein L0H70_02005 [Xanthomonadales bacterium]|nr:hypothetical protein [Xanthomonadales bacterium]